MINKNFDLLGEQLAESGLEMSIAGVFAGISAAASIAGGIFGATQASDSNKEQKKLYKQQQKDAKEAAKVTNEYNKKKFEVDKENYYKQAEYQYQTAVKRYQYDNVIQAYKENQEAKRYAASIDNMNSQLVNNEVARQMGMASEQRALNETRNQYAFEKQDVLIKNLQAQGKAALGQAGKSQQKAVQSGLAEIGRTIAVMDASLRSAIDDTNLALLDIENTYQAANERARASAMMRPDKLPDIPPPSRPPDPTWIEPMKILPQAIPPPQQQSVALPIIQGISGAFSTLSTPNLFG